MSASTLRNSGIDERVRSILAVKNLTVSQISQRSEALYGRASPHFIPHNFYYDLRSGHFSPSIHQLVGLSRITGYRLRDWVRVFGADVEDIARMQVALPARNTVLLDSSLTDTFAWIPWFEDRAAPASIPPVAPLGQLLRSAGSRQICSLQEGARSRFLYARIGEEDALAFPDLVQGSIVRVSPNIGAQHFPRGSNPSRRYFLIEHSQGLFCCRLRSIGHGVIVPVSTQLSYAQVELRQHQVRLLGVADLEIRPVTSVEAPTVPAQLARQWLPRSLSRPTNIGKLLRHVRDVRGLSLREASVLSGTIAKIINDERYFVAPTSLCDYELSNSMPRRVETMITLCSLYGLSWRNLLKALEIDLTTTGRDALPDQLVFRGPPLESARDTGKTTEGAGFVAQLLERCEEVPFFLRRTIPALCGLEDISLEDIFWIGGEQEVLHPYIANGLLAVVNRRRRKPMHFPSKPLCQQPVYVLLRRDGAYLCACCGVENGSLVVHPYSDEFHRADVFRYRQDVEVVGQIVMIARRLT